jgi:hypothetical protein
VAGYRFLQNRSRQTTESRPEFWHGYQKKWERLTEMKVINGKTSLNKPFNGISVNSDRRFPALAGRSPTPFSTGFRGGGAAIMGGRLD